MTGNSLKDALGPQRWNRHGAWSNSLLAALAVFILPPMTCSAAEAPFFITYTHQMEEPGNLEFGTKTVIGKPRGGNRFLGATAEFEYGVTAWWTSELYLDVQATASQSTDD